LQNETILFLWSAKIGREFTVRYYNKKWLHSALRYYSPEECQPQAGREASRSLDRGSTGRLGPCAGDISEYDHALVGNRSRSRPPFQSLQTNLGLLFSASLLHSGWRKAPGLLL